MTTKLTAEEPSTVYKVLRESTPRLGKLRDFVRPRREKVLPSQVPHLPYVGMEHVEAHTMRLLGTSEASTMKSSANRFYAGDVLYGRLRPYLNKVLRADFEGICSPEFIVLPKTSGLHPDFIRYRLNSHDFVTFASHLNAGDRPRVDFDEISQFTIAVPSEHEQREAIAYLDEQLSRLDASVAALLRAQANLKRYRASVLKAACEGRLVPTEAELARAEGRTFETGEQLLARLRGSGAKQVSEPETKGTVTLPDGWGLASVDMVGDVLLGRQRAPQYLTGDATRAYLRVANIKDDRIDFDDLNSMDFDAAHFAKYRLEPGDILVSEGQSPELLGQSAIFHGHSDPLCFQKTLHRFRAYAALVTPDFAQLVFRSHLYSGVFRKFGSITTNIGHLTLNRFKAVWFPLPPLPEQHRIVAEADRRLSLIRGAEAQVSANLARAKRLRQSILQAAFARPGSAGQ